MKEDLMVAILFLRTNFGTTESLQVLLHDKVMQELQSDTASIRAE